MNQYNKSTRIKAWANVLIPIVSVVIDIAVFGFLGESISKYHLWWLVLVIISFSVISFVVIWQLAGKFLTTIHYSDKRNISKTCLFKEGQCCGQAVCDSIATHYELIPSKVEQDKLSNEYGLYLQSHIKRIETFQERKGKEVWIISSNLNSEVFLEKEESGASFQVKENVKNGVEYYYLYFENPEDPEIITRNQRNIKRALNNASNVHFISLGAQNDIPDEYILYLYGIVIYVYEDDRYEGFFSLRSYEINQSIEPLYMRMPVCLSGRYYNIMKQAKMKQEQAKSVPAA